MVTRPDVEAARAAAFLISNAEGAALHLPDLRVSASDASTDAMVVARANADALGLEVELSVARGLPHGHYDLVTANLPYVCTDELAELAPEIDRYEPRAALAAGPDGLNAIRELMAEARPGTLLAC